MRDDRKAKLANLLADTCEAYYWAGFLMADGSTTEDRITLGLATRDEEHLRRFGDFVAYRGEAKPYRRSRKIACMDKKVVPVVREKFGFRDNKTENPPMSLPDGTDAQRLAFVVGFIDGDGSMRLGKGRRFCNIAVKVHGTWLAMMRRMACFVYGFARNESGCPKLNAKGYAEWVVSNSVVIRFMEMGLPILRRKWDKVVMDVGEQEMARCKVKRIRELAENGLTCTQVARAMGEKIITIWCLAQRHGVEMHKYANRTVANV